MNSIKVIIDELTNGLNPQQKIAVTAPFDKHYLILAGAGCGKTSVLTRRIAFCTLELCEQHELLALTFTRKAAEEMRNRVLKLPGIDQKKEPPTVTTFHGFSLKVLRDIVGGTPNIRRLGYTGEPHLLSSNDRLKIIASLTTRDQRRELKIDIHQIDNLLARHAVNKDKIRNMPENFSLFIGDLRQRFSQRKVEQNAWEFSDMITQVIALFSKYENIAAYYAKRFKYILVDEFQDTNPLQITLLNNLLSKSNRVFAVGDDDQAIYGFRGADIEPTIHFKKYFQGADVIKLETNYRSRPAILKCANKIFEGKSQQYRKILSSGRYIVKKEFGHEPKKKSFQSLNEMVHWIGGSIESLHENENIPVSNMALLFRINETLDHVKELYCKQYGNGSSMPSFLTVHGSKGLEFPVVFLCDLEESIFPSYRMQKKQKIQSWFDLIKHMVTLKKKPEIDCDFEEEKRLFYVGVTRAEMFLYLISVKEKVMKGRKVYFKPSRFTKIV